MYVLYVCANLFHRHIELACSAQFPQQCFSPCTQCFSESVQELRLLIIGAGLILSIQKCSFFVCIDVCRESMNACMYVHVHI